MKDNKIVLPTDPEAATYRTDIKGWVSRDGFYFGEDERTARYAGATHRICDSCGKPIPKSSYCRECYDKKQIDKYNQMPKEEWNGKDGLYSQAFDKYLWDLDDVDNLCEENGCDYSSLRLIICNPVYTREIDPMDFYQDDLPEDGEIPDDIQAAFDELNERIREAKSILCWIPGKKAALIKNSEYIPSSSDKDTTE